MTGGFAAELRRLLTLQRRDSEHQQIQRQIAVLTEGREVRRVQRDVEQLADQLQAAQKRLTAARVDANRQELAAEGHRQEKDQLEARMYSGKIVNVKEMNKLTAQIAHLEEMATAAENAALAAMEEGEDLAAAIETLQAQVAAANEDLTRLAARRRDDLAAAQAKEAAANAARDDAIVGISAPLLDQYRRMLERPGLQGLAVVPVQAGACGGCAVGLSMVLLNRVAKMDRLYACENCGRGLIG